jgi:hypothetical protein
MASVAGNAFDRGRQAGVERVERAGFSWDAEGVGSAVNLAQDLIRESGEETSDRFDELFAELVTVGAAARRAYSEPELTRDDISQYLIASWTFLNSFRHA